MYSDCKKEYGGLGVRAMQKDDIRHNDEFCSRDPQCFFPSFFDTKKGGRDGLNSQFRLKEGTRNKSPARAVPPSSRNISKRNRRRYRNSEMQLSRTMIIVQIIYLLYKFLDILNAFRGDVLNCSLSVHSNS